METSTPGKLRALIVDDNRDGLHVFGMLLQKLGCQITTCAAADDCLDHARRTHPHLILLDIAMPKKSGFTVAEELLQAIDLPRFYLVAVSGYGGAKFEETCKAAGFHRHLLKPASTRELRELIISAHAVLLARSRHESLGVFEANIR